MEINYRYIKGKYRKSEDFKAPRANEMLNLKQFQDQVDKKIRKFEIVTSGYFFPLKILKKIIKSSIVFSVLLLTFYIIMLFLKIDFVKSDGERFAKYLNLQSTATNSTNLDKLDEKKRAFSGNLTYFQCTPDQTNSSLDLSCLLKKIVFAEEDRTADSEASLLNTTDNALTGAQNEVDNEAKTTEKSLQDNDLFKPILGDNNGDEYVPIKNTGDVTTEALVESKINNKLENNSDLAKSAEKLVSKPKDKLLKQNSEQNFLPQKKNAKKELEITTPQFYSKAHEKSNEYSENAASDQLEDLHSGHPNVQKHPTKETAKTQPIQQSLFKKHETEASTKSKSQHTNEALHSKQKDNYQSKIAPELPKSHSSHQYSNAPAPYYSERHSRNLEEILPEVIPKNNTNPVSVSPIASYQDSLLVLNGRVYQLSEPSNGHLGIIPKIVLVLVIFNLMVIVITAITYIVTEKQIFKKVNETVIDMVIEENSESGIYKFLIYGSFRSLGVKVNFLTQDYEEGKSSNGNSDSGMLDQNVLQTRKLHLIKKNKVKKSSQRQIGNYKNINQNQGDSFNLDTSSLLNDSTN
jgi:hypothetical protein